MLHACEKCKIHTFSSFREIKTNSLLPRIAGQQLRHFRHQRGVQKVGKRQFPTSVRIPCLSFRPQKLENRFADFNDTYIVVQQI